MRSISFCQSFFLANQGYLAICRARLRSLSFNAIAAAAGSSEQRSRSILRTPRNRAGGNCHASRFIGQVDRALFDHTVNVISPGVIIRQHVDGQVQLVVQTIQQASHAAGRLPPAVRQQAIVFAPKIIFVEAGPDRRLLDMQHKLGLAILELDHIRFDDGRDPITAAAHVPTAGFRWSAQLPNRPR